MLTMLMAGLLGAAPATHPVFPPPYNAGQVDQLREEIAPAMKLSLHELYDLVPIASGIFYCGCPNCDGGSQDNAMTWELGMGSTVRCAHCGMVFPNETFPNNRERTLRTPRGETQVYRWYENAEGRQFFFEAAAWYRQWEWTRSMALRFASLYALTKEEAFADRAAVIVGRFAQVFPDYALRFDYPYAPVRFWPADQKWPYDEDIPPFRGAKFHWWAYCDIPTKLARAYDLIAPSDAFECQAALLGGDIRPRIENDLIRLAYEFTIANPDSYCNMSPGLYEDMIIAGRVLGAPEMVHEAVERFRALVDNQFFADGWWRECAPSYHWQTVSHLLKVVEVSQGYSDPPDWPVPRFENLDLETEVPMLAKACRVLDEGCLPDGRLVPVNDTWASSKREPFEASICRLWPGMGLAVFGAGSGDRQFQAHLNWNASYGHAHMDSASIILFARGKEMLSDIGYTHTRYRNWTLNSASHNLVVVDARSQPLKREDPTMAGQVRFLDMGDPHVRAIDLDMQAAYPQCSTYRRRIVHIHAGEGLDYLVDWFDVEGGSIHDYFLHGSADEEGTFESSLPLEHPVDSLVPSWGGLEEHTGEDCIDLSGEKHHPYVFLRDIHSGEFSAPWRVSWQYEGAGLCTYLFPHPGSTLFRCRAPSIRRAGKDDSRLDDYLLNLIIERHASATSHFRAVHIPFRESPWVDEVRCENGTFTIQRGEWTDTIRWDDQRLTVASSEGWSYDSGEPITGPVVAVEPGEEFAICTDRDLPKVKSVRLDFGDRRAIVYLVERVEGPRFILADDAGFTYDPGATCTQFVHHPHERIEGPLTWTIWLRSDNQDEKGTMMKTTNSEEQNPAPATDDPAMEAPELNLSPGPEYGDNTRRFQGIPGIERAENGRLWAVWYAGGPGEGPENYVLAATSGDDGRTWEAPMVVIDPPGSVRAFDPCLWHDPTGRLWLFWAQAYHHWDGRAGVWAITTEDSGACNPRWSPPRRLCNGIMMNKPIVFSSGTWMLPVAIWRSSPKPEAAPHTHHLPDEIGSGIVCSDDAGTTWIPRGRANVPESSGDEHMLIERSNGDLWMLVRTRSGLGESTSSDAGFTWSPGRPSAIAHIPTARFFIRRLRSGRLLLVKHDPPDQTSRSHLKAFLSDDEGETWYGGLLLDERDRISYPDGLQAPDGRIYIIYDYNRYADKDILLVVITEEDIASGEPHSEAARLRILVNHASG